MAPPSRSLDARSANMKLVSRAAAHDIRVAASEVWRALFGIDLDFRRRELASRTSIGGEVLFLFVDDDDNVAKAFAELAESLGHRAETASSGGDALRMAGQTRYDTVFMDIGLPDIDGRTLCEFLRSAGASVEACIVAVTGQRDLEDNLLEPFDGFLAKPATESELKRIIHRC